MARSLLRPGGWFGTAGLLAGLALLVASCGEYAPAEALVTAPIVKQGQCAPGYVRSSPNSCATTTRTFVTWTNSTPCQATPVSVYGVPANAQFLDMEWSWRAKADGVVSANTGSLNFFSEPSCTGGITANFFAEQREWVALAVGTVFWQQRVFIPRVPVVAGDIWSTQGAFGNGTVEPSSARVITYYD